MSTSDQNKIFFACCLSLVVTAMTLATRAQVLPDLGTEFSLDKVQLGWIAGMAFLGFPLATMIGGLIYNHIGAKKLLYVAFAGHLIGLLLTIFAGGFWGLLISTFCIGFANGSVEAGANPLIADMYHDNKTTMLNKFHVWFPGGIVIGSLIVAAMKDLMGLGWQLQIAMMLIPTLIYGYLIFTLKFPEMEHSETSTTNNIKALFSPLFIFMLVCMTLTATSELGTQQWVMALLGHSGAHPMIILALVTGLMAVGRFFAGPIVHALNPAGVLLASSIIASIGIYMLSVVSGGMVYVAAILFALGVMYFWPTMLGFVSEYLPKTGALGLSTIGGVGMFAVSMWSPVIGYWIESAEQEAIANGTAPELVELAAGQSALANIALFPLALVVLFTLLYLYMRKRGHDPEKMEKAKEQPQL